MYTTDMVLSEMTPHSRSKVLEQLSTAFTVVPAKKYTKKQCLCILMDWILKNLIMVQQSRYTHGVLAKGLYLVEWAGIWPISPFVLLPHGGWMTIVRLFFVWKSVNILCIPGCTKLWPPRKTPSQTPRSRPLTTQYFASHGATGFSTVHKGFVWGQPGWKNDIFWCDAAADHAMPQDDHNHNLNFCPP